jgi:hypothetical protein
MVTQRSLWARLARVLPGLIGVLVLISFASACDKMPLLAPGGTVITIFPATTTVPLNGEIEIVATVIENGTTSTPGTGTPGTPTPGTPTPGQPTTGTPTTTTGTSSTGAGTPVQNGTLVSFTTTVGRIEPSEARTQNGQVRVKFMAGGQSGVATITAFSGGASGRLENLRVGTAAVERVVLTANPQTLSPTGGSTELLARVEDASGLPVVGVPVTFSTTSGQIAPNPATTDAEGLARATLTTTREADVTATVAGKRNDPALRVAVNPRTGISITAPTTTISAGLPATFTVNVASGTGAGAANIRDVTIDFGDGSQQSLGAISGSTTVQHTYNSSGTFPVRAIATDASGFTEQVATSVTILPAQPPGVTITASDPTPNIGQIITLTATATGATSTIQQYQWDFGDGTTATTTGPQITKSYGSPGTKVIRVTVVQTVGPIGTGQTTVDVQP